MTTMPQRIVVGLNKEADAADIVEQLKSEGAANVRPPSNLQPDAIVAEVPDDTNVQEILDAARQIPGVRYAEADSWRMTE